MATIDNIKSLLDPAHEPILSLYLHTDPADRENQATVPAWRRWLKNVQQDFGNNLNGSKADIWSKVDTRLEALLASVGSAEKSLVIFIGNDIEQVYTLPVALPNAVSFGEVALTPLLHVIHSNRPYLLTLADHEKAHLWVMSLDGASHEEEMTLELQTEQWREHPIMPATAAGGYLTSGSHRDRFSQRVAEHTQRFYSDVAERMQKIANQYELEQGIVCGNLESAHAVHHLMSSNGIELLEPVAVAHYENFNEVQTKASELMSEHRNAQDAALVDDVHNMAMAHGRGALADDVVNAIEYQNAELLLVPWPVANNDYVNKLANMALRSGADVIPVTDYAADVLRDAGGALARLYYVP